VVDWLDQLRPQLIERIEETAGSSTGAGRRQSEAMRSSQLFVTVAVVALAIGACSAHETHADTLSVRRDAAHADSITRARQDSINRATPGYVIDSLLPPEEEARRFRAAYPGDSATVFVGGEASRDALVRRFVRSLAAADTNDLRSMVVTGREFVDIYFPHSPYASGPYHQPVSFAWRMIQDPSVAGFTKLIRRLGGHQMHFVWQRCEPDALHEGRVDRYTGCLVRFVDERGDSVTKRLFGSIVSYEGQYKFLSYTNDI